MRKNQLAGRQEPPAQISGCEVHSVYDPDLKPSPPGRIAVLKVVGGSDVGVERPSAVRVRRRRFELGVPEEAITWNTGQQRSKRMFAWQLAVMTTFGESSRLLRVAWLLQSLCLKLIYEHFSLGATD